MNRIQKTLLVATATAGVAGFGIHRFAGAQDGPPPPPPGRPDGNQLCRIGPPMGPPPAQMVVTGNHLVVLQGNTLLKIDPNSLQVVQKSELPRPERPPLPGPDAVRRPLSSLPSAGAKAAPKS
ncbi:MAG: hypothetical protein KY468_11615 [Armatimonadetes bacterium]|nr:hypothetical protein [Armatimonadota bacterium]